jgi:hypothetical protein
MAIPITALYFEPKLRVFYNNILLIILHIVFLLNAIKYMLKLIKIILKSFSLHVLVNIV